MVDGVHQTGIDARISQFEQIGGNHLGKDLSQKTTNFIGRTLSRVFSKSDNTAAVTSLISDIRKNPEFGDRYAKLAQAQLSSVGRGTPLTGRTAGQVLSQIKLAKSEDTARRANIGINIDTHVPSHADSWMDEAFAQEQEGIGAGLITDQDREAIRDRAIHRLKSQFTQSSPSPDQMKEEFTAVAREHCRVKIMEYNDAKIEEVVDGLAEALHSRLEQRGEGDVRLSDAVIGAVKKKIANRLAVAGQQDLRLYQTNDPAILEAKNQVTERLVAAFTCVTDSDLPQDVKRILKQSLASDEIMLTEDISRSVIQAYEAGICDMMTDAVAGQDRSDRALADFAHNFLLAMERGCLDPDTRERRRGIDGYSLETVKFSLCTIAMKTAGLDQEPGQARARDFYHDVIAASARQEDMLTAIGMETLAGHMALAAGLMPEIEAGQYMERNPEIPEGAKDMVKDIFTRMPRALQSQALELVKENTCPPRGLPTGARVELDATDPAHPKPVLAFNSRVQVNGDTFTREFGETTTVSDKSFGPTVLADQFVMDLARASISFGGTGGRVEFDTQEAVDAQISISGKQTENAKIDDETPKIGTGDGDVKEGAIPAHQRLEEKFVWACEGNENQARALSILLNQSFAGSVAVGCTKDELMPATGGGSIVFGAGTDHGPFQVTRHGEGSYTVSYSGRANSPMLTAGSPTDMQIPVQMVGAGEGRSCELELSYTYEIDLKNVGPEATERDLAQLIRFHDGSPGVGLKFIDA